MKTMNLTPAALNWLGSAFEKKTKISPFSTAPDGEFTQEGLDDLVKQGIVTPDKDMTTEAYAILDVLAGVTKFASVHLAGGSGHVNRVTYWNGDKVISLDNSGQSFTLSTGGSVKGIEVLFSEITGSNRLVNSNFSARFDHRSALVFAALFDLSRRAAMRLYADGTIPPAGFSAAEITQFATAQNNARWLTSHLKALKIPGLKITGADAQTSLKNLIDAGIIEAVKGGLYTLINDSAELAAHFLFIENTVHFRCGGVKEDGKIVSAECLFLQAGVHDVIMVDVAADRIEISALSSYAMIDAVKNMMTTPPAL